MVSSTVASSSLPLSIEHTQQENAILTPSRKVRALLAQFDDSDSDRSSIQNNVKPAITNNVEARGPDCGDVGTHPASPLVSQFEAKGSDDEVLTRGPRGRLAARMQGVPTDDHSDPSDKDGGHNAYTRIKAQIAQMPKPKVRALQVTDNERSDDELQCTAPRRRLLRKQRSPGDRLSRPGTQSPSPLFFPSPSAEKYSGKKPSRHTSQHDSDSEKLPDPLQPNGSKFLALVEKHRKQRLAREAAGEAKRAERLEQLKIAGSRGSTNAGAANLHSPSGDSDISDGDAGTRLTQQARPTRKASKKALNEMSRETQRMSRSMQLAHQAKTRKKITKESLLARFNFITPESEVSQPAETGHLSTTTSSAAVSDGEGAKEQSTPPTSPMSLAKGEQPAFNLQPPAEIVAGLVPMEDEELPATEDLHTQQPTSRDKGKTKATTVDEMMEIPNESTKTTTKREARLVRVRWSKQDAVIARGADSDSDLEIVTSKSKSKKFAAFESLPQRRTYETNSHLILRSLAYMQPGKAEDKHAHVNAAQMEARLRRAARLQAQKEREEKLEELKSKGIFIQTAEERQREQQEVEDLVEQARVEGAEIQRREKEKAKRDGTFVKDQLDDDESADEEDADFQDENEELEDHESGSEDEIEEGSDQEGDRERENETVRDHEAALQGTDMINQEADEAQSEDGSEDDSEAEEGDMTEKENQPPRFPARGRRTLVLSDDEDDEVEHIIRRSSPQIVKTPQSVLRSARKIIPGLQMSDDLPIGLTQAFAATMADSLSQDEGTAIQEQDPLEQDSLALALDLPSPQFNAVPSLNRLDSVDIITDSQPATQTQPLHLDLSITQTQVVPQLPAEILSTQLSFMPTQDVGYMMSPFKENRFDTPLAAPHSTIDTVVLPPEEQSPILQRKGRLRRGRATMNSDDEALGSENRLEGLGLDKSAFAAMQRAAKRVDQQSAFDKTKSHAKEVVDEAAEESEDEYAGLGGASDDEEGEEDEADKRIIDHDESLGQGDEGTLAGFYADKERKQDEAAVSKLLRDITTGALRRKRGAADDIDLSDEEDASARRREAKRREFARMRRELLKDEAVGKIAEDKKKQAFLKSIEDRDEAEDEDMAFRGEEQEEEDSQPQPTELITIQSETPTLDKQPQRKRPLEPSAADISNRPPPALRRTSYKAGPVHSKPSTLAEIREHVSFLIDEPDSQNGTPGPDSSDDEAREPEAYVNLDHHLHNVDGENEEGDDGLSNFIVDDDDDDDDKRPAFKKPHVPTTRAPASERRTKPNVIDRLSLLRRSSSSSSSSSSTSSTNPGSKLAFFASKSSDNPSSSLFKTPSLLRRATTNSSFNSESGNSTVSATGVTITERGAVEHEKEMIRKAQGGRRSAINFYAKGRVEEREMVREGRVRKGRVEKRKSGGTGKKMGKGNRSFLGGLFGKDSWE